jgi:hypothetical protein
LQKSSSRKSTASRAAPADSGFGLTIIEHPVAGIASGNTQGIEVPERKDSIGYDPSQCLGEGEIRIKIKKQDPEDTSESLMAGDSVKALNGKPQMKISMGLSRTQSQRSRKHHGSLRRIRETDPSDNVDEGEQEAKSYNNKGIELKSKTSDVSSAHVEIPNPDRSALDSHLDLEARSPGVIDMSPIMSVAEIAPCTQKQQVQRPVHLELTMGNGHTAREDLESLASPMTASITGAVSPQTGTLRASPRPEDQEGATPHAPSPKQSPRAILPKPVGLATMYHRPGTPPASSLLNTAFPVPPRSSSSQNAETISIRSSQTSDNRGLELEAQIEALQRENRLLEAALMAVLKASGTLNRCPCIMLSRRHESGDAGTLLKGRATSVSQSKSSKKHRTAHKPNGHRLAAARETAKLDERGEVTSEESDSSGTSGISALEVYLNTRLGCSETGRIDLFDQ